MILVDSSVWIDYFNGISNLQTNFLDANLSSEEFIVGDLIYTEVLQGFNSKKSFQQAKVLLDILPFYSIVGKDIAIASAQNFRFLRKSGVTVRKTIDVLIATFCIKNDITLLQNDKDFGPFITLLNLKSI